MGALGLVYRYYEEEPAWGGFARSWFGYRTPAEWEAFVDHGENALGQKPVERRWFDDVETAIAWARRRSPIVHVLVGNGEDATYSAGSTEATEWIEGRGGKYPQWPPDNWPDYKGPAAEKRRFRSKPSQRPRSTADTAPEPSPRFSYRFVPSEADNELGMCFEGSITVRKQLQEGDEVWFPTQGYETWEIVRLTDEPRPDTINPYGHIQVGSSGTISCRGATPAST